RVADDLKYVAPVRLYRALNQRVVTGERTLHRLGVPLPEPGAALDVREKERDGASRNWRHRWLDRRRNDRALVAWCVSSGVSVSLHSWLAWIVAVGSDRTRRINGRKSGITANSRASSQKSSV